MPQKIITWHWEEAFDKFGFDDGDGYIMTNDVVDVLEKAGYECFAEELGIHNVIIQNIEDPDGKEIWSNSMNFPMGYTNPRMVLPQEVIDLLDKAFPSDEPYPGI